MANETNNKDKASKEYSNVQTARDKGVNSSDWLYFFSLLGPTLLSFQIDFFQLQHTALV